MNIEREVSQKSFAPTPRSFDELQTIQVYDPSRQLPPVTQPRVNGVFDPGQTPPAVSERPQPGGTPSTPPTSNTTPGIAPSPAVAPPQMSRRTGFVVVPSGTAPAVAQSIVVGRKPQDVTFTDVVAVGSDLGFYCSGVLVGAKAVLTARHCGHPTRIGFGSYADAPLAVGEVASIVAPPDITIDVQLLRLTASAPYPPRQRRGRRDTMAPAGLLRVIGFGATVASGRSGFGVKRLLDLPATGWGCDGLRPTVASCDPENEMVIASNGGRDTCDGDSGGPVLERWASSWRLVGITSRPLPGSSTRCGGGGIYVRVDRIDTWLREQLRTHDEETK